MSLSLNISAKEKKTFYLHFTYSIIEGIIAGVLALNEFVLIKALHGSNYQIGFLFQFQVIVLLFAVFLNEFLRQTVKKRKLLRVIGIITRIPLLLFFLFPANQSLSEVGSIYHYLFLGIFLIYFMANPIIFPMINLLLKNSYTHGNFGRLYGYSTTINKIIMLVSTFFFGIVLDINPSSYRFVYPVISVLGVFSIVLLSRIDYKYSGEEIIKVPYSVSIKKSYRRMVDIIKTNLPYRDFEIGFMLYGFAWMSTSAVITIFFEDALHLNYSSVAFYKNSYNILAIMLLPFFGKLIGKIDPRNFALITFGSLLMSIFFMGLTEFYSDYTIILGIKIYYSLIASYLFYGVFAATMALLWYIGSSYFCKDKEAGDYQSVHLSLTGIRGLIAPLIGVFFYELLGFAFTFGLAIFSLFIAVLLMIYSVKKRK